MHERDRRRPPDRKTHTGAGRRGLGDHYRSEILPWLTAAAVFSGVHWSVQRGRWWRGPCPLHGDDERGSRRLSVDTETLHWKCFSCGRSGDALAWLAGGKSPRGPEFLDAVKLAAELAGRSLPTLKRSLPGGRLPEPPSSPPPPARPVRPPAKLNGAAARLLGAALPAADTPAARYLVRERLVWPVDWNLPADVQWVPREDLPPSRKRPPAAVGAVLYALREPASGRVLAAQVESLTERGRWTRPRWRRCYGAKLGLRFVAVNLPGGSVHVAEGEVTALALAVQCRARGRGMAVAVLGDSGMRTQACRDATARPVVVHADRDRPGRIAARKLRTALRGSGRQVRALGLREPLNDGLDAADVLSTRVGERFAIGEVDGGLSGPGALQRAWSEVLAELGRRDGRELK